LSTNKGDLQGPLEQLRQTDSTPPAPRGSLEDWPTCQGPPVPIVRQSAHGTHGAVSDGPGVAQGAVSAIDAIAAVAHTLDGNDPAQGAQCGPFGDAAADLRLAAPLCSSCGDRFLPRAAKSCSSLRSQDAWQLCLAEAAKLPQRARWWTGAEPGTQVAPRCAQLEGTSLHANVAVARNDRHGLRRLVRYGAAGSGAHRLVRAFAPHLRRSARLPPVPWAHAPDRCAPRPQGHRRYPRSPCSPRRRPRLRSRSTATRPRPAAPPRGVPTG